MQLFEFFKNFRKEPANAVSPANAPPETDNKPDLAPMEIAAPERKAPINPRRELEDRAYQHGYKLARESGLRDVDASALRALESDAVAMAQAACRPPSAAREERRTARMSELFETRKRQDLETDRAAVTVANTSKSERALGPRTPFPTISRKLYFGAMFGLTISTAPTFHDMFVGLDGLLMWLFGGLCAVGVSLFIVHGIVQRNPEEEQ